MNEILSDPDLAWMTALVLKKTVPFVHARVNVGDTNVVFLTSKGIEGIVAVNCSKYYLHIHGDSRWEYSGCFDDLTIVIDEIQHLEESPASWIKLRNLEELKWA